MGAVMMILLCASIGSSDTRNSSRAANTALMHAEGADAVRLCPFKLNGTGAQLILNISDIMAGKLEASRAFMPAPTCGR